MLTMEELEIKRKKLDEILKDLGSVAVAFSSGVDSTFLLKAAHDVLGDNAVALTLNTVSFPEREMKESEVFCKKEGIKQIMIEADAFSIPGFADNPPDRCYICKRALFSKMKETAAAMGITCVAEGSNLDDMGDYRPGMKAIAELGILSPLREAGMTKADIRALSKELELSTWDKPSFACLATRFVYGERITEEKLNMVEKAEQLLMNLGFGQFRVRIHGMIARIEIRPSEFEKLLSPDAASSINAEFRKLGFEYVTLDLGGYVMGSMNRPLDLK